MPWRKTLVVSEEDQKLKFVSQVMHKELSIAAACAAAGISRKTCPGVVKVILHVERH